MSVRCGRTARAKPYPSLPGYITIPAWSRGKAPYNQLSPMLIGPFTVTEPLYNGQSLPGFQPDLDKNLSVAVVQKFENYWQGSKIYAVDLYDVNKPIDFNNIKPEFYHRRAEIFANPKGVRRALLKFSKRIQVWNLQSKFWTKSQVWCTNIIILRWSNNGLYYFPQESILSKIRICES